MRMQLPWDAEWPEGRNGDLAVCAWLREGWSFEAATDRGHAETLFAEAQRQPALMVVMADQGRHQGAVVRGDDPPLVTTRDPANLGSANVAP